MTNTTTTFDRSDLDRVIRRGSEEQLMAARDNAERADDWESVDIIDEEISKRISEAHAAWDFWAD